MTKPKPLSPSRLRARLDPKRIPYETSAGIPEKTKVRPPQPRALQALEIALSTKDPGFNVYIAGDANLGRSYLAEDFLAPRAAKRPVPDDLVYVHNFDDSDNPKLLTLPAGGGAKIKKELDKAVAAVRKDIPQRLNQEKFIRKKDALARTFNDQRSEMLREMERDASKQGFELDMDGEGSMTLYPLVEGKVLAEDEFEKLDSALRQTLKKRSDDILEQISRSLRRISKEERDFQEAQKNLEKDLVKSVLDAHFGTLKKKYAKRKALKEHLANICDDMLDNMDVFMPQEQSHQPMLIPGMEAGTPEDFYNRYTVNKFVDNSGLKGAPLIMEDHPTAVNLLGCIEREAEMGALYTDFTLVQAGALHKANGGFLVLRTEDLSQNPEAWEGLLRALRSGKARIEDANDGQEQNRTRTIRPEPVPLDVRVILIGTDLTYEALLSLDDRFPKLFKLKAHMQDTVPRTSPNIRHFLHSLARIIREGELPPFDRGALAALVDYSTCIADDQKRLSLCYPLAREVMVEAAAQAKVDKQDSVTRSVLDATLENRIFRVNLYEDEYLADYDRELIKVATSGQAVGRANGLAVTMFSDHEFGLPHQIACTVGVGHGGIIDLEREAELGGPIHTKAMMILKSYLLEQFAQDKPIVLTGSIAFEQSYAGIEGDSASGAELVALLSALSGIPVDLSYAFTGAVSQSGKIMAVGGVTPKIEGFYKVCKRRGLTGRQGVIIPKDNVQHLMLGDEVCEAVEKGEFHIYSVSEIGQALELLMGMRPGKRGAGGKFPTGTLYRAVDNRLAELADLAAKDKK